MTKTALVTGAGHGIGKAIAVGLAEAGYDVAVTYCGSSADDTCEKIAALGRKTFAIRADLSNLDQIAEMFNSFFERFNTIDVLVNNAGITKYKPFLEVDRKMFNEITNVDWRGAYFCSQHAAKNMVANGIKGNIINIISNHRLTNFPIASVYAPNKAALYKFTQHLALELASYGIRANSISPGYIKVTDPRVVTDREKNLVSRIPVGRIGQPEEIGSLVRYLVSEKAAFITGSDFIIDGGALLPAAMDNTFYNA